MAYTCDIEITVKKVFKDDKGNIVSTTSGDSISLAALKSLLNSVMAATPTKTTVTVNTLEEKI